MHSWCREMSNQNFNSTQSEEAPLVSPTRHGNYNQRLGNPTMLCEIETTEQFAEEKKKKTSNFATMMHLLKGNIGTGILAMPKAISHAGLLVGSVGIPILGVICVHCMHMLVKSSKDLAKKLGRTSLDYATTAEAVFLYGPEKTKKLSSIARFLVNFMIMLTQFGFCCVYFLFVSKSFFIVVDGLTGSSPIPEVGFMGIILPLMILFNYIRNLDSLSHASLVANIVQIGGLLVIFYFLFTDIPPINSVPMTAPISKLPLYFGTAMYAFEGIGVVLPLENAMETPEDFAGKFGVLNTSMVIVACLYTAVGFYGYLKYGANVQSSITFNIRQPVVGEVVRLMFAVAIFLSYALQLYVPLEIVWPFLKRKFFLERYSAKRQLIIELILRTLLVILTFVLAAAIPQLELFISLVGAMASSSLALIFPSIIDSISLYGSDLSRSWMVTMLVKNSFIFLFGITGCVMGTYVSVEQIVCHWKNAANETLCDS